MKFFVLLSKIALCLALCAGLASADSLQLRNGRRLQGKYIGGTSTALGFLSGASVEYFSTTDVLILMFDNAADSSLDDSQRPSPMSGDASTGATHDGRHPASIVESRSSTVRKKTAPGSKPVRSGGSFGLDEERWSSSL